MGSTGGKRKFRRIGDLVEAFKDFIAGGCWHDFEVIKKTCTTYKILDFFRNEKLDFLAYPKLVKMNAERLEMADAWPSNIYCLDRAEMVGREVARKCGKRYENELAIKVCVKCGYFQDDISGYYTDVYNSIISPKIERLEHVRQILADKGLSISGENLHGR